MISDTRFVLRLLGAARGAELVRAGMTVLGVFLAVLAGLAVVAVPQAVGRGDSRVAARAPVGETGASGLRFYASTELVGQRAWTRITVSGVEAGSPCPPGVAAWPAPGEVLLSPALEAEVNDRGMTEALGGRPVGHVAPEGLSSPEELLSYDVSDVQGGSDVAITSFGDRRVGRSTLSPLVLGELALLVALPEMFFLFVVLRLSLNSRRARSAALDLLGVDRSRQARMFSLEMSLLAGVGAGIGVGVFLLVEPWLGHSGVLGTSWFPGDGLPTPLPLALVVPLQLWLTWLIAGRVMRGSRRVARPWTRRFMGARRGAVGPFAGACLLVATGSILAALVTRASTLTGKQRVLSEGTYVPVALLALVLGIVGVGLSLAGAVRGLARVAGEGPWPGVRLGARIARSRSGAFAPLGAAVAAGLALGGLSTAALVATRLDGIGDLTSLQVSVNLLDVDSGGREAISDIRDYPRAVVAADADPSRMVQATSLVVADCASYTSLFDPQPGDNNCSSTVVQTVDGPSSPGALAPGGHIDIDLSDGSRRSIEVPDRYLAHYGGSGVLVPPGTAPWVFRAKGATVHFQVSALDGSYDRLMATIHEKAPTARPQSQFKDAQALADYYEQAAVLHSAIGVGFLLTLLALVVSMLDLRWATARVRAAQIAMGVPTRARLASGMAQALLPVGVSTAVVVPLTLLLASYFTAYWGPDQLWAPEVSRMVGVLSAFALSLGLVGGLVLTAGRLRLTDLSDE